MKKFFPVILSLAVLFTCTSCLSSGGGNTVSLGEGRNSMASYGYAGESSETDIHGDADCTGLTDADMKALIANYDDIMNALEEYGADYTEDDYATVNADIEAILEKYGISGPGRYNKLIMAHYCELVLAYDEEMKKDITTALTMKAMGIDPMAEYRSMINDDDLAVVKNNYKSFKKVVENY